MIHADRKDAARDHDRRTARAPNKASRPLRGREKRLLALLGVPTFALALAITIVSAYMPVVARGFTRSTVVIGVIVGAEGLMALWLPLIVGSWSDRLRTRLGGRLPFLLAGTPVAVVALAIMGFVGSIYAMAAVVAVFFVGYFIAYEPYRALYPDAVADEIAGRAQSTQALWRGVGTLVALLGGGLLLSVGKPVPFLVGAAVLAISMATFIRSMAHRKAARARRNSNRSIREELGDMRRLVSERVALRAFLYANTLWELSLAALKTFVVLYLTRGLHFTTTDAALIIGTTAVFILAAAAVSGKLGDRFGRARVMKVVMPLYGVGLLVPLLVTNRWVLGGVVPFVALGGGFVMSLPYAIVQPLMPKAEHGAVTGYYSLSRGIGTALGPLFAGVAINELHGTLSSTHGYAAVWLVCSLAVFASIVFLRRLERCEQVRRRKQEQEQDEQPAKKAAASKR
jgi:MFS family permease